MKIFILVPALATGIATAAFCASDLRSHDLQSHDLQTSESWLAFEGGFHSGFAKDDDLGSFNSGGTGMGASCSVFLNGRNVGFFVNIAFFNLNPWIEMDTHIESQRRRYRYSAYFNPTAPGTAGNFVPQLRVDYLLGPAFRHGLNERLTLYYGAGLNVAYTDFEESKSFYERRGDHRFGFGIGGNAGLRVSFAENAFLNLGTVLHYNFVNVRQRYSTSDNWKNTSSDSWEWIGTTDIGIRPYLAIGFSIFDAGRTW